MAQMMMNDLRPNFDPTKLKEEIWTTQFWLQFAALLLMPSVIAVAAGLHGKLLARGTKLYRKWRGSTTRNIEFKYSSDYWTNSMQDDRNNILQKAIMLYIADKCQTRIPKMKDGQFRLVPGKDENESWSQRMSGKYDGEALRKFHITPMPPKAEMQQIDDNLWFMYDESADESASAWDNTMIHHYSFTSYGRHAEQTIDDFIQKCYKYYLGILRKDTDKSRYLYQMQVKELEAKKPPVYKRYKLSEDKTFDSLFFEGKNEVLALLQDFLKKRGKFAIEGFPNKLGLLLHGPPGTGKTSFVKALAAMTNRHIVSVPLANIATNQQLYDIMFDLVFPTPDDDGVNRKYGFRDLIFLMEDIDASSDIVKSRKHKPKSQEQTEDDAMAAMLKKFLMAEPKPDGGKDGKKDGGSSMEKENAAESAAGMGGGGWDLLSDNADKLDLAGLLNVLDGVIESPGRMVIMTTNHPEMLDAALIRPGRINTKLHMGYMTDDSIVEMVQHHFPEDASDAKVAEVRAVLDFKRANAVPAFRVAGAEVEQLCAECDTLAEFIEELRAFPRLHKDLAAQVAQYNAPAPTAAA